MEDRADRADRASKLINGIRRDLWRSIEFIGGVTDDHRPLDRLTAKWIDLHKEAPEVAGSIRHALSELSMSLPGEDPVDNIFTEASARIDLLPPGTQFETLGDLFKITDDEVTRRRGTPARRLQGRRLMDPRWPTAIHEAGHAVAARAMGYAARHVTIVPDEEAHGRCISAPFAKSFEPGLANYDGRIRRRVEASIIILCAGENPQGHVDPDDAAVLWGSEVDYEKAHEPRRLHRAVMTTRLPPTSNG